MEDINGRDLRVGDEVYYARKVYNSARLVKTHITEIKGNRVHMGRMSCSNGSKIAKIR